MGEFEFIGKIRESFRELCPEWMEGIGDDCAVIPAGKDTSLVITTDTLTEGIHFLRQAISPYSLGWKSLAVNLSDVASMGATPIATLLSVALPADVQQEWAEHFMEGYRALSQLHRTALIGGDTTASAGSITINVVAIGRVPNDRIKRRSMARVGDVILVAGKLGDSAAGLRDVLNGNTESRNARIHLNPQPQVREGIWLGCQPAVHAMTDLSDGLASDLPHILEESGVGAVVETSDVPTDRILDDALSGGEDYKLLLTADAERCGELIRTYRERFDVPLTAIGRIVEADRGLQWLFKGQALHDVKKGYTHF